MDKKVNPEASYYVVMFPEILGINWVSFIVLREWEATTQMALNYSLVSLTMRYLVLAVANRLRGWKIQILPAFQASGKF